MSRLALRLAAFLVVTLTWAPAHAALFQVSDMASLYATDSLAWTDPEFTMYGDLSTVTTTNGAAAVLAGGPFTVFSGSTFNANFLAADSVLSAFDLSGGPVTGPIRIGFNQLFAGVGAQIQAFGVGPFTATLRAFDSTNALLGWVTIQGITGQDGDGSAPFIGLRSDGLDIAYVEFDAGDGMGINAVGLSTSPVPEPATLAVMAMGLGMGVARFARRRRHA